MARIAVVTAPNGRVPNGIMIELPQRERMWTLAPTRFWGHACLSGNPVRECRALR
jgi:hypothetical protein